MSFDLSLVGIGHPKQKLPNLTSEELCNEILKDIEAGR